MKFYIFLFLIIIFTLFGQISFSDQLYKKEIYKYQNKSVICMIEQDIDYTLKDYEYDWTNMTNPEELISFDNYLTYKKINNYNIEYYKVAQNFKNLKLYPAGRHIYNNECYYYVCVKDDKKIIWDKILINNTFNIYDIKKIDDSNYILVYNDGLIYIDYITIDSNKIYIEYRMPILLIRNYNIDYIIDNVFIIGENYIKIKYSNRKEIWRIKSQLIDNLNNDLVIQNTNNNLIWTSNKKNKHYNNYKSYDYFEQDTEPTIEQLKEKFPNDTFFR